MYGRGALTGGFKPFGRIRYDKHLLQRLVLQHESIRAGFKLVWRKVLLQVNWGAGESFR